MSQQQPEIPEPSQPNLADALSAAARKSAFAHVEPGKTPTGHDLFRAVGGARGLVEALLPGLMFLVVYTITEDLVPSVIAPVVIALLFVAVRVFTRSPLGPAVAGVIGVGASAGVALFTGQAEDNFLLGFIINGASVTVLVISLAARWPLIGVIVGLLRGDVSGWRSDKAQFRVAVVATLLWIGVFSLRLAVQLPLYLASQTQALAATKLLMGVPLYAATLWVTWLLVRAAYTPVESKD
ncbi:MULTISPECIES: DUF3159 domain-containing protein [unclassified Diaminobutyricimonas]|uniref:DUF3159 domain-containing protein n=1 Tax=unclassified Diaminobutyricimonas TaxID=2643261 RepID=UPI0012F4A001|nr:MULTISPECIES: DUF3159 domain-containing protein [unclassified Diaminobutyricimonas]